MSANASHKRFVSLQHAMNELCAEPEARPPSLGRPSGCGRLNGDGKVKCCTSPPDPRKAHPLIILYYLAYFRARTFKAYESHQNSSGRGGSGYFDVRFESRTFCGSDLRDETRCWFRIRCSSVLCRGLLHFLARSRRDVLKEAPFLRALCEFRLMWATVPDHR